jgi:hypothetical protein
MTNHRRLRPLDLRLSRLTLGLNSRRLCSAQLLIVHHLLPGSFTLGLLLLPHHLSLVLRRWHGPYGFANTLTLCSLIRYAFNSRLLHLLSTQLRHLFLSALITSSGLSRQVFNPRLLHSLSTQLLHLLPGAAITSCGLSRQIGNLPLPGLLRSEILRRLSRWRRCRPFVS